MLPWAKPEIWGKEREYVCAAVDSTWISGGPFVSRFEEELSRVLGVQHVLSVANGTAALQLALLSIGLGPTDDIIVPGFGFMAAANVALQMGLKPVFADVDPDTWCLDVRSVENRISPRTRIIVPIHTYGNVCDLPPLLSLAKDNGIDLVEDAAEAFLSAFGGRFSGTFGRIGCFSFQATKTITTGEGGIVVTCDDALFEKMDLYRNHGMGKRRYYHQVPGNNFRLTNLQAALGCAQLEYTKDIIKARKRVHSAYRSLLENIAGVQLQVFREEVDPVLWAMAARLDPQAFPQGRDAVMGQLFESGVETRPGFYSPREMSIYGVVDPLPVSDSLSTQVISLPTYVSLKDDEIERICHLLLGMRR
jgi:perosamine synthetase